MKLLNSVFLYISYLIVIFILLIAISMGDFHRVFSIFNLIYLPLNLLFSLIYIRRVEVAKNRVLIILAILSIVTSFLFNEVVFRSISTNMITLSSHIGGFEDDSYIEDIEAKDSEIRTLPKAEKYLLDGDYASAWLQADLYLEKGGKDIRAHEIKEIAMKSIVNPDISKSDKKYIDSIVFKSLINQSRILDAYYYCLENRNSIYDYDFLIKFRNSYLKLLEDYYSVDLVQSMERLPGYSDIRFYSNNGGYNLFEVEKVVEYQGYTFLYNLNYLGKSYPYVVIDPNSKVFTSGFYENINRTIIRDELVLPVKKGDLKLFSKEFYPVIEKSLLFNLELYNYENIKYLESRRNNALILKTIVNYLTLFAIFFIPLYYINEKKIINYTFNSIVNLMVLKWFIYKIGLMLIELSLGLSIILIISCFILWINFVRKGIKLLPSQF